MTPPRVLVLHAQAPDFLADSILHGLRVVLGERAVDVPRRHVLYDDYPLAERADLYGKGFTLYTRLPDPVAERPDDWLAAVDAGEFDVVVLADIHRNWGPWLQLHPRLEALRAAGTQVVALDGGDGPVVYPYGPTWWRTAPPWRLPRAHGTIPYYKRELSPLSAWARAYGLLPPPVADRLLLRDVRPIGFSIPEDRLARVDEPKTKLLTTHIVDPDVAALVPGAATRHAFASEDEYYGDLRASRFGVTTRKAGWETLRHYELAASGCVPCLRDPHLRPARSAPFGLDATNSVGYTDAAELVERIGAMPEDDYERLRAGALAWARRNTTRARATALLADLGHDVGAPVAAGVA